MVWAQPPATNKAHRMGTWRRRIAGILTELIKHIVWESLNDLASNGFADDGTRFGKSADKGKHIINETTKLYA